MKQLIVITGASSGIGAATARVFSKNGHPLLLLARRVEKLEELQLPNTICEKVDVTDCKAIQAAIAKAEQQYGAVDCLVNNAGVMLLGLANHQDPVEWKKMFDVNVIGVLNGIHCVLQKMMDRQGGTVVNISSIAGRKTFPNHSVYCGTKFAIHAISENIREEVAPYNVRVTTIAPGAVETELLEHTTSQDIVDSYKDWKTSMGGAINSTDVANAVYYAYSQPQSLCIREIVLAATRQQP
jgi:NADP-dependent 3-hydroxy acid dehydrogenase YdfG